MSIGFMPGGIIPGGNNPNGGGGIPGGKFLIWSGFGGMAPSKCGGNPGFGIPALVDAANKRIISGPISGRGGIESDEGAGGLLDVVETGADPEASFRDNFDSELAIKFAGTEAGKGT